MSSSPKYVILKMFGFFFLEQDVLNGTHRTKNSKKTEKFSNRKLILCAFVVYAITSIDSMRRKTKTFQPLDHQKNIFRFRIFFFFVSVWLTWEHGHSIDGNRNKKLKIKWKIIFIVHLKQTHLSSTLCFETIKMIQQKDVLLIDFFFTTSRVSSGMLKSNQRSL